MANLFGAFGEPYTSNTCWYLKALFLQGGFSFYIYDRGTLSIMKEEVMGKTQFLEVQLS